MPSARVAGTTTRLPSNACATAARSSPPSSPPSSNFSAKPAPTNSSKSCRCLSDHRLMVVMGALATAAAAGFHAAGRRAGRRGRHGGGEDGKFLAQLCRAAVGTGCRAFPLARTDEQLKVLVALPTDEFVERHG